MEIVHPQYLFNLQLFCGAVGGQLPASVRNVTLLSPPLHLAERARPPLLQAASKNKPYDYGTISPTLKTGLCSSNLNI